LINAHLPGERRPAVNAATLSHPHRARAGSRRRGRRARVRRRRLIATIRLGRRPRRARYDRGAAERYWGEERPRLGDELRIVLSAGEPPWVNAAYHTWETTLL